VGGMISCEIRNAGRRVGFQLEDITSHRVGILAHSQEKFRDSGPTVGNYHVNLLDIETIGAAAIVKAVNTTEVIIIDEIGPMELKSKDFVAGVELALNSEKSIIGTIHWLRSHPLINSIKSNPGCRLIEVSLHNRGNIPLEIVEEIIGQAP